MVCTSRVRASFARRNTCRNAVTRFATRAFTWVAFLGFPALAFCADIDLQWDPAADDPLVTGYEVHYGLASGNYDSVVDADADGAATSSVTIDNLLAGNTYYFAVRSRNHDPAIVSAFSNEVVSTMGPVGNQAPVVSNPGAQYDAEGETVSLAIVASDPEGDSLTYTAAGLPTGLSIDSQSGRISGTLNSTGTYTATVTVSDGSEQAHASFSWMVRSPGEVFGLVAAYNFEETGGATVTDVSGNGNNGVIDGATRTATGQFGNALSFDGADDSIDLNALDVDGGEGLTISAWIRADDFGIYDARLVSKATGDSNDDHYWMLSTFSNNSVRFRLKTGGSTTTLISDSGVVAAGQWHHVAATYDGLWMRLYVDGVQVGSAAKSGAVNTNGSVPASMGDQPHGGKTFDGLIDEVRLYNRGLAVAEIQADMATPISETDPGPIPNQPPSVDNPGGQAGTEGDSVSLAITATDPDGDALTYAATGLPTGLSMDSQSGIVSGTLSSAGTHGVTVTVSDGSEEASAGFSWVVSSSNQAPVATNPGAQSGTEGETVSLAIEAIDPDGDALTYSAAGLPTGLSINSQSGHISGTLKSSGSYTATVSVSDSSTQDQASFSWIVRDPDAVTGLVAAYSFEETGGDTVTDVSGNGNNGVIDGASWTSTGQFGAALSFDGIDDRINLNTLDVEGGDGLTISAWIRADDFGIYDARLVSKATGDSNDDHYWMLSTFSNNSVRFRLKTGGSTTTLISDSGVVAAGQWHHVAATYDGLWMRLYVDGVQVGSAAKSGAVNTNGSVPASMGDQPHGGKTFDGLIDEVRLYNRGLAVAEIQADMATPISETDPGPIPNQPPSVDNPGGQAGTEGDSVSLAITATDPDGDALTYAATGLPTGLSMDSQSGIVSGTLSSAGTHGVTVTVSDGSEEASAGFSWVVSPSNQAPVATNPGAQSGTEGETVSLAIEAIDPDGDALTYSAAGLPTGLSINSQSGHISGTLKSSGSYTATVSVSDSSTQDQASFSWIVRDPDAVTGLVAAYSFEEAGGDTVTDVSGNGNNGVIDGASWTSTGQYGAALSFDGINDRIDLNALDVEGGDGLTISAWMKADDFGTYDARLLSKATGDSNDDHYWMLSTFSNNSVRFRLKTGGSTTTLISDSGVVAAGQWHHVAATYDGRWMRLYVDGEQVGSTAKSGTVGTNGSVPASMGNQPHGGLPFDGLVDEVRLYNRGLAVAEIQADMATPISETVLGPIGNQPPIVDNPGVQTGTEGDTVSLTIAASDPDGDPMTYAAAGLPKGLSIDSQSGRIGGTLDNTGTYIATVTVSDGSEQAHASFEWVIDIPSMIRTEAGVVTDVTNAEWTLVTLEHSYDSMVVVATPRYSPSAPPQIVRVRNASGNNFELAMERVDGHTDIVSATVDYLVVEEGVYDEAIHGVTMEAVKYTSVITDSKSSWEGEWQTYANTYSNPVVIGQVMSANDPLPSSFWARGSSRTDPPDASTLYTGKTVSEDPELVRAEEVIGYIVIEAGNGTLGGRYFEAGVGEDLVKGTANDAPYEYPLVNLLSAEVALLSMAAMDGKDGGWPVLAQDPNPSGASIGLAVDEDTLNDSDRSHTTEQIAYLVLEYAVEDENRAPMVTTPESFGALEGSTVTLQIEAADPDGDQLSYWAFGLPLGLSIDPDTGLIEGNIAMGESGIHEVVIEVEDGTSITSVSFDFAVAIE